MAEQDDGAARLAYTERLGADLALVGFPRMPGRVLAALMVAETGRLTSAELSARLQASPAAISGAVRYLEQINLVRRDRDPGSRRDHYSLFDDTWVNAIRMRDQAMSRLVDTFKEGVAVLGEDTVAGDRMVETLDFWEFIVAEGPQLVDRWLERRDKLRNRRGQFPD